MEKLNRQYAFYAIKFQSISLKIANAESCGLVVTRIQYGKRTIYKDRMDSAAQMIERLESQMLSTIKTIKNTEFKATVPNVEHTVNNPITGLFEYTTKTTYTNGCRIDSTIVK